MSGLKVENVSYRYHAKGKYIVNDISLHIKKGECLGIIGLNGSGKTTLSYLLCGIIPNYFDGVMEGNVWINEKNTKDMSLANSATYIGIVLQDPNIQIMMPTVEDELAFGLENHGVPRNEIKKRIEEVIEFLKIENIKDQKPNYLSGGQKQLVALAAVLVLQPEMIIFDESLSMLDSFSKDTMINVMKKLKQKGKSLIVIDHTEKGIEVADKVLVLEDGKIIYKGNKEDLVKEKLFLEKHKIYL